MTAGDAEPHSRHWAMRWSATWGDRLSGDSLLDGCKSVIVHAAIDVDRLAGDEAAILAD